MSLKKIYNDLKADIECALCLETLLNPRLLPCGHRFCHPCLQQLEIPTIRCPLCRQASNKRAAELPPDTLAKRIRQDLRELWKVTSHLNCGICVSEDSGSRCFDCHTSMCEQCLTKHTSLYKEAAHGVVKNDTSRLFCSNHGTDLDSICLDCNALVCNSCIIDKCSQHTRTSVTKAIDQYFRTREEKLHQTLYSHRNYEALNNALSSLCDDAITQIQEHSNSLIDDIKRETTCLAAEVQKIQNEAFIILSTTNEAAQYLDHFHDINETDRETGIPSKLFKKLPLLMRKELEEVNQAFNVSKMKFVKQDFPGIGHLEMRVSRGAGNAAPCPGSAETTGACDSMVDLNETPRLVEDPMEVFIRNSSRAELPPSNSTLNPAPLIYGCQEIYMTSHRPLPGGSRYKDTFVINLHGNQGSRHAVDEIV